MGKQARRKKAGAPGRGGAREAARTTAPAPEAAGGSAAAGLGLLAAVATAVAVYAPGLGHEFVFDDLWKIVGNPELRSAGHYFAALGSGEYSEKTTRLLPNLSFVLDHRLHGFRPFGFHLTNLLLHLASVALVGGLGLALARRADAGPDARTGALLGAALFALHPLNSEAVNYCNARPNLMATACYCGALTALLHACDGRARTALARSGLWLGFGFAFVGALLSKELAATLALMIPLILYWFPTPVAAAARRRATAKLPEARSDAAQAAAAQPSTASQSSAQAAAAQSGSQRSIALLLWLAPAALGLGALALTGALDGIAGLVFENGVRQSGHWALGLLVSALGQSEIFLRYAALAVLPLPAWLNADRSSLGHLHERLFENGVWRAGAGAELIVPTLCALLLLGLLAALWRLRRRHPLPTYLALWPFVTHAPTSLLPRGEPMVEYRSYLPMVGICLLLGLALCALARRARASWPRLPARAPQAAALALLALLAAGTATRNRAWATQESLWRDVQRKSPDNARAHQALGNLVAGRGDLAGAEEYFRRAIALEPLRGEAHGNLGSVLAQQGRSAEAVAVLERAAQLVPNNADVHNNLGNLLTQQQRHAEAIAQYEQALAHRPHFADAHANLALVLALLGRHAEARAHSDQAVDLRPDSARFWLQRAQILLAAGDAAAARAALERAAALDPANPLARSLLEPLGAAP